MELYISFYMYPPIYLGGIGQVRFTGYLPVKEMADKLGVTTAQSIALMLSNNNRCAAMVLNSRVDMRNTSTRTIVRE